MSDSDPWAKNLDCDVLPLAERFQNIFESVATEENALRAALAINHDARLVRWKEENLHVSRILVSIVFMCMYVVAFMLTLVFVLVFLIIVMVMAPVHDDGLGFDRRWLATRPRRRSLEAGQFLRADGDRIDVER